jgi:hypothetical protein
LAFTLNSTYTLTFSNMILFTNNLGFSFMVTNAYDPHPITLKMTSSWKCAR